MGGFICTHAWEMSVERYNVWQKAGWLLEFHYEYDKTLNCSNVAQKFFVASILYNPTTGAAKLSAFILPSIISSNLVDLLLQYCVVICWRLHYCCCICHDLHLLANCKELGYPHFGGRVSRPAVPLYIFRHSSDIYGSGSLCYADPHDYWAINAQEAKDWADCNVCRCVLVSVFGSMHYSLVT